MIQGHIFVFFGKEIGTQKGRTPENNTLACAVTLMLNPKTSHNFLYLTGQAATFTASWMPSNILALLTDALARLKMVILGNLPSRYQANRHWYHRYSCTYSSRRRSYPSWWQHPSPAFSSLPFFYPFRREWKAISPFIGALNMRAIFRWCSSSITFLRGDSK